MIQLIGLDFTEEPHLFEKLSNPTLIDIERYESELYRMARVPLVLVLTCNRAEVYSEGKVSCECLERALGLNTIKVKKYRYSCDDPVLHILMLSSGVLSPRFGEDSVISQIRNGWEAARSAASSSSALSKLFNMAVSFGKEMHSDSASLNIDHELVQAVIRRTEGAHRILIVGSGLQARELAAALLASGHEVSMTLRDVSKLFLLPVGIKGLSYDERRSFVSSFDAIISSSSGIYHTFEDEDLPLFRTDLIFDLSSPPDLPLAFNAITRSSLIGISREEERRYNEVSALASKKACDYKLWLECREGEAISCDAEDFAYSVIRRLKGPLACTGLSEEKRKSLQNSIFETVRKAYISDMKSRRK